MVLFNYTTRELTAKIVYYGPGLCGKTTNLLFIHENLPDQVKGKMLSLATKTDRTLFFDFLPIDLGEIRGMKTRVQLYTVPGQVFYNETRKLVLKGADGIVFVADSQEQMMGANIESFRNLEDNLKANGMNLAEIPHVVQFNKRDLPRLSGIEDLNSAINRYNAPFYESVATTGIGVQDTLKAIVKLVLLHLTRKYESKSAGASTTPASPRPASAPAPTAPAQRSSFVSRAGEPAPVTAAESRKSVPVSDFKTPLESSGIAAATGFQPAVRSAPPPPDFRGVRQTTPDWPEGSAERGFAESEIDDLVEEVAEEPSTPMPAAARSRTEYPASWSAPPMPVLTASESAIPAWRPAESAEATPAAFTPAVTPVGPSGGAAAQIRPREASWEADHFEINEEFGQPQDVPIRIGPEKSARSEPVEEAARPGSEEPAAPTPAAAAPPEEKPAERVDDETVLLSEVARDEDLFRDPTLEVATLATGEAREILVPVELRDGAAVRRFKLSVRLRLDPLD
jgi:hypothetical protein